MDCLLYPLASPRVVAVARDSYLTPTHPFPDPNLPRGHIPHYGQDFTFGTGRAAPGGHNVGATEAVLKPKMAKLLTIFASNDRSGMASRLFTRFQSKLTSVAYFDDMSLSHAAAAHPNINYFINAALAAPGTRFSSPARPRIHQALGNAGWDISRMTAPTDLGVPALNNGSPTFRTGDFSNGLGVMINGIQYVYVVATHYHHDAAANKYCIKLVYYFYDVFGLDDDDLDEYGARSDGLLNTDAGVGITAWWQLQHQHGYAPLVTRIILSKTFEVSTV